MKGNGKFVIIVTLIALSIIGVLVWYGFYYKPVATSNSSIVGQGHPHFPSGVSVNGSVPTGNTGGPTPFETGNG